MFSLGLFLFLILCFSLFSCTLVFADVFLLFLFAAVFQFACIFFCVFFVMFLLVVVSFILCLCFYFF